MSELNHESKTYPASYRLFQILEKVIFFFVFTSLLVASSTYWFPESRRYIYENEMFDKIQKFGYALAEPFEYLTDRFLTAGEFPIHLIVAFMVYALMFYVVHTVFLKLYEIS